MRGLYEVFIVDPKTGKVITIAPLVASDENNAKMKAVARTTLSTDDLDDYDIIARKIGDVRAKKSVQEVKVVEKSP